MPFSNPLVFPLLILSAATTNSNAFAPPRPPMTSPQQEVLCWNKSNRNHSCSRFQNPTHENDNVTKKTKLERMMKRVRPAAPLKMMSHPYELHYGATKAAAAASSSSLSLSSSSSSPHDVHQPFDYKSLDQRLESLQRTSPDDMAGFYESHLHSFSVRPGSERFSVTSSLFALECFDVASRSGAAASLFARVADLDVHNAIMTTMSQGNTGGSGAGTGTGTGASVSGPISLRGVLDGALMADWNKDDLFQVPLLVHILSTMDPDGLRSLLLLNEEKDDDEGRGRVQEKKERCTVLIESLLDARPLRRSGQTQPLSEYLLFLVARAMSSLHDVIVSTSTTPLNDDGDDDDMTGVGGGMMMGGFPADAALPEDASAKLSLGLSRSVEVSFNELCRQLAYWNAGDRNNFDAIRLAYSLLTYVTTSDTLSGTAGIELIPGEGPTTGSVVGPPNVFLVREALRVFFEEQNEDGLWDKGQPIYKSFRRTGRNVGNAFVFATDTVGGLLKALPADYFRPHMTSLEKMLSWIEAHQVVEVIPNYCDPVSLKCYGRSLRGWSSPHLTPDTSPQAWSTAQTITCICRMRQVVRELMHEDVLSEFGGISISGRAGSGIGLPLVNSGGSPGAGKKKLEAWERLLDTDLGDPSKDSCRTLKCVLEERFVKPFEDDFANPTVGAAYSAILFGPPGTAKTTICEALAERMGLDFLVIDTSVFLADGLTNVASRIRYVFTKLMELEQCVILFDEIEEFCLDRETEGLGMESRMLTTAMLTAINDLRRKKRSIFFLATNRLRAFDSAITRPGRFDMQLFVGTPNLDARCIQLSQKLGGLLLEEEVKESGLNQYRSYLQKVWTKDAMFMNYLEGLQFASACADIVASGNELSDDIMDEILSSQAAVMTVRGPVRDEYIASMELSRL